MTVLNTGANKKYTQGWEAVFGGKKAAKPAQSAKPKAASKKPVKKAATKKKAGK
jgi:hypothetical protein